MINFLTREMAPSQSPNKCLFIRDIDSSFQMVPIVGFVQPFFYFIKFLSIATISCLLSLSLSPSHFLSFSFSFKLSHTQSCLTCQRCFLPTKQTFTHVHPAQSFSRLACSPSISLSLSLSHTHTHTHTPPRPSEFWVKL